MNRLALLFTLLTVAAGPAAAVSPNPKDLTIPPTDLFRARGLVGKLGSEDFTEREDAQDELAKMGRLALPALLDGMNENPSPEVRSRCEALLPRAAAEDLQARLATFLADTDGKYEHDLPGWNQFRKIAGSSAAAREVFGELLADQPNRELVLAVSGPPAELGGLIADRKQEFYRMRFPRAGGRHPAPRKEQSLPDLLALMFAESHIGSKFVPAAGPRGRATTTVYNLTGLSTAVADGGEKTRVYRAVVGRWVETRDDVMSMYQACTMAQSLNMPKEAAAVCGKLVGFKGGTVFYRANAALTIARLGAKEQLPALEAAFADDTALRTVRVAAGGNQEAVEVQIRDLALAAAVMLTGQEPEDYGLVEQYKGQAGARFNYSHWQLPAARRKAAFDRWKAWRAKHPDFGKDKGD